MQKHSMIAPDQTTRLLETVVKVTHQVFLTLCTALPQAAFFKEPPGAFFLHLSRKRGGREKQKKQGCNRRLLAPEEINARCRSKKFSILNKRAEPRAEPTHASHTDPGGSLKKKRQKGQLRAEYSLLRVQSPEGITISKIRQKSTAGCLLQVSRAEKNPPFGREKKRLFSKSPPKNFGPGRLHGPRHSKAILKIDRRKLKWRNTQNIPTSHASVEVGISAQLRCAAEGLNAKHKLSFFLGVRQNQRLAFGARWAKSSIPVSLFFTKEAANKPSSLAVRRNIGEFLCVAWFCNQDYLPLTLAWRRDNAKHPFGKKARRFPKKKITLRDFSPCRQTHRSPIGLSPLGIDSPKGYACNRRLLLNALPSGCFFFSFKGSCLFLSLRGKVKNKNRQKAPFFQRKFSKEPTGAFLFSPLTLAWRPKAPVGSLEQKKEKKRHKITLSDRSWVATSSRRIAKINAYIYLQIQLEHATSVAEFFLQAATGLPAQKRWTKGGIALLYKDLGKNGLALCPRIIMLCMQILC
jgi:hypothetical protein